MGTQTYTRTMEIYECSSCGVTYGISQSFGIARREDGRTFYCPNGHSLSYYETDVMRLKKQLSRAENKVSKLELGNRALNDQLEGANHSLRSTKGHLTRAKTKLERVEKGVCPECNRSFVDLHRHMKSKHPGGVPV